MFAAAGGKMLLGYLDTSFSMMSHGPCRDCEVTLNIDIKYYNVMNITKINVQNKYLFSDIDIKILSIFCIEDFCCELLNVRVNLVLKYFLTPAYYTLAD